MSSLTLIINPEIKKISCIEIPGVIKGSGESAVKALGGESVLTPALGRKLDYYSPSHEGNFVRSAHTAQSSIFIRSNPNDRFSKFLISSITPRCDILLKVKRNKKNGKIITGDIIGLITEKFKFDSLADFYCAPPEECLRSGLIDIEKELNEEISENLFIPPPAFTRLIVPFNYKFEENNYILQSPSASSKPSSIILSNESPINKDNSEQSSSNISVPDTNRTPSTRLQSKRNTSTGSRQSVAITPQNSIGRFSDAQVPSASTIIDASSNIIVDTELKAIYSNLFNSRPIWLRTALELKVPCRSTSWKKRPVLAHTCFWFPDGPWRGTLCRLGFDPKTDPQTRIYQTIDFRDPYFREIGWKTQPLNVYTTRRSLRQRQIWATNDNNTSTERGNLLSSNAPSRFTPNLNRNTLGTVEAKVESEAEPEIELEDEYDDDDDTTQMSAAAIIRENEISFRIPPTRPSFLYQLCDIDDAAVQEVLSLAPYTSACSKVSGWFSKEIFTRIRDLMMMSCKKMRAKNDSIKL